MSRKKIKVQIPSTNQCTRCGDMAKVSDIKVTDNIINVYYMCDCGWGHWKIQIIEFI